MRSVSVVPCHMEKLGRTLEERRQCSEWSSPTQRGVLLPEQPYVAEYVGYNRFVKSYLVPYQQHLKQLPVTRKAQVLNLTTRILPHHYLVMHLVAHQHVAYSRPLSACDCAAMRE
jgi:hypothetical protein